MAQMTNKNKFYIKNCIINIGSNDEFKEIHIENCTCYYFDGIIKIEDFDLHNIFIDEKAYKNILIYGISYKPLIGAKPLCISCV